MNTSVQRPGSAGAFAVLALLVLSTTFPGTAQTAPRIADTYQSRVEALAIMQTINAEILASPSATQTLETWCREHDMASDPVVIAVRVAGVEKPASAEQLERLKVSSRDEIRYRRVQLRCGSHVFSEADNWYVPARLTPEMNEVLETTDTSFGRVVRPLQPYRRTFLVSALWAPLPEGWERHVRRRWHLRRRRTLVIPQRLFEHRAVLYTKDHLPFSEVHEVYQSELLAFTRR